MSTVAGSASIDAVLTEAKEQLRTDPYSSMTLMRTVVANDLATPEQSVDAHLILSRAHIHVGEYDSGEPVARNALSKAREQGLRKEEGLAHNEVGIYRFVAGDFAAALHHYEAAEHLLKEVRDEAGLAKVFINVGNVYNRSMKQVRAIAFYEKALLISQKLGDDLTIAKVHSNLSGLYYHVIYDPALASEHAAQAISAYRRLNDNVGLAKALVNRAVHLSSLANHEEALKNFEESLELRKSFSEPDDLRMTYDGIVLSLLHLKRIEEAEQRAKEAEEIFKGADDAVDVYMLIIRARIYIAKDNPGKGAEILRNVVAEMSDSTNEELKRTSRDLLASAALKEGSYKEAATLAFEALEKQREQNRTQASQSLARIKVELDLAKAEARTEAERMRNRELATMLHDLEAVHRENEEFVAVLAHELKSPLSTIRSLAGMLSSTQELSVDERQEFNREIHSISTRMFDLIAHTLEDASKRSRTTPPITDARAVWTYVLNAAQTSADAKGVGLRWSVPEEELLVSGSEQQLALILENLVSNAIKFSVVGTDVKATVIHQTYGVGSNRVLIRVSDQGPGVSEEEQDRLFRAFEQLSAVPTGDEVSTGLGLHLVKKTVDQLGGRVWCESVVQKGATFFVELPLESGHKQ